MNGIDDALKEIIQQYAEKQDIEILGMEVMPDYVHLLLDCPVELSPLAIVKSIKQASAVQLRRDFPELKKRMPCLWTRSSFVSTVGFASMDVVKKYIEEQKGK